jgi:hypothetical protein
MSQDHNASRRNILKSGLGVVAAGAAIAVSRKAAADEKLAQNLVQYQQTPKDGNECDKCVNWEAPNGCKIVAGTIAPKGWCVAFAPKEG